LDGAQDPVADLVRLADLCLGEPVNDGPVDGADVTRVASATLSRPA
jgi:hypothetical protein